MEEESDGLKIERIVDKREEQPATAVQSISEKSHKTRGENSSAVDSNSSWRLGSRSIF